MTSVATMRKKVGKKAGNAVLMADPIADLETDILAEIRGSQPLARQRIQSYRRLSHVFGTSTYRVRCAVDRLERKGFLHVRHGSGVYLTEKALSQQAISASASEPVAMESRRVPDFATSGPLPMLHVPIFKTLRVQVPGLKGDEIQVRMWRHAFDVFHREYPLVNLDVDFADGKPGTHDVLVNGLHGVVGGDLSTKRPLDGGMLEQGGFEPKAMPPALLQKGRIPGSGELRAIPLLRIPRVLAVNHRLFAKCGMDDLLIERPVDWFRAGHALQEKLGGGVWGFNYSGVCEWGCFYGITIAEKDGQRVFDRARMSRFLEDMKPFIRRDQLSPPGPVNKFFNDSLGIWFLYLYAQPWIAECLKDAATLIRLPFEPGGYAAEGGLAGIVPEGARQPEEATLLLGFLASAKGQAALTDGHPEWVSVRRDVLKDQKAASPFPAGAVVYDYDPRSFVVSRPAVETESVKFYLGMQGLEETLDKMERV